MALSAGRRPGKLEGESQHLEAKLDEVARRLDWIERRLGVEGGQAGHDLDG